LLIRYGTSAEGKPVKKAEIYTAEDHRIDPALIDVDARRIIHRLRREGFRAFVVGGAVRDLLTGLKPKDFDIATDALPRRIRKIFRSSRIIGRRFRLVHIYAHRDGKRRIFEVSTFRSGQDADSFPGASIYGSMEEDVWRRDFTINALYYCPHRRIIIDFVGGYRHIREGKICTLTRADVSFQEDPVRMIRGIKYAEITGFPFPRAVKAAIKRYRRKLAGCSPARLTEELYKILESGHAAGIFRHIFNLKLMEVFLPALHRQWSAMASGQLQANLASGLGRLDQRGDRQSLSRGTMLAYLMRSFIRSWHLIEDREQLHGTVVAWIQQTCKPLLPSRRECERAARLLVRWATA
jgi:poly(A) polymerase